jgi:hypothetical protein
MKCVGESNKNFYISKSTQQGAGQGLFATKDLKKGDALLIVGVIAKARECVRYADNYSFVTNEGECWVPLGFGAIVNHANNPAHQNVEYANDPLPEYRLLRDIKKDEELLTNYGAGFANTLATHQVLGASGNLLEWEQECIDIAESKEGKELYEKVF